MSASARFNALPAAEAVERFRWCGGSRRWAAAMAAGRPYLDDAALHAAADREWDALAPLDLIEAVEHHPRIGGDLETLRKKFSSTASWSAAEQSGVASADEATLARLSRANLDYEARFGHTFIVCATGKTATEMLAILQSRLAGSPAEELAATSVELRKILHLRLEKTP